MIGAQVYRDRAATAALDAIPASADVKTRFQNRRRNDALRRELRQRLTSATLPLPNETVSASASESWPEGQPEGQPCAFVDWTKRPADLIRPKLSPLDVVQWQGQSISLGKLRADAAESAAFGASLDLPTSAPQAPKSGLVSSSTSAKRTSTLDSALARVKRMRKAVLTTARLHASVPRTAGYRMSWVMLTLTLAQGVEITPRDVSKCIDHIRKWARRHWPEFTRLYGFRYVWTMELTQAGVPHYHVLIATPYNKGIPKPDDAGWWPHGMTNCGFARRAVGYIAKYASKLAHAANDPRCVFPKGFRITGSGGLDGGKRDGFQHREKRFWMAPHWARDAFLPFYSAARVFSPLLDLRRVVGGFVDKFTGQFEACPWAVVFDQGRISLIPKVLP